MRIVLIAILYLLLASVSSAKSESLTVGPYNISFDLNTTLHYSIDNNTSSKAGVTYDGIEYQAYSAWLNSTSNFALITVVHFNNIMCGDIDKTMNSVEDFLRESKYDDQKIRTTNQKINGQQGILGVGENTNGDSMFVAQYWQESRPYFGADTNVLIESNYPWYNETHSLVDTICVKNVK